MSTTNYQKEKTEKGRILRLLNIMQDIRLNPIQSLENILKIHEISRSQFYKDKTALAALGFVFEYHKKPVLRCLRIS